MGTRDELDRLLRLCVERDVRPVIEAEFPLEQARDAFTALQAGDVFGKLVLTR
jgi:D-arabinose 1-dehydrogenase-like Zn-dependent alcohol dehydrogenase